MIEAFLVSSSFTHGRGYLEHVRQSMKEFLGPLNESQHILFCPWAAAEEEFQSYNDRARDFFESLGCGFVTLSDSIDHHSQHGADMVGDILLEDPGLAGIFIAGGSTFRLLDRLNKTNFADSIVHAVGKGLKYMGASAGTLVACPTIKTTNDMPIISPYYRNEREPLEAMGICPIQVNAHFVPGSLVDGHMGETRERRIFEYHQENDLPVVGLPERSWLRVSDDNITLHGEANGVFFQKGKENEPWVVGETKGFNDL